MKQRGYTIIELLVAMGVLTVLLGVVYTGVRPQVRHAGEITRAAQMQSETRAAFDLMARDLRMAGYGVDLTMPGVPAPIIYGADKTFWGNFTNVRTTGSGAGSLVTVANGTGFKAGNYLVINSTLFGGEARVIAGVSGNTVVLANPLSRAYAAGSAVHQLEPIRYLRSGSTMMRNGQAALSGVQTDSVQYYLEDGSLVTSPPPKPGRMRGALVSITAVHADAPAGSTPDDLNLTAEVRIRNLGLVDPTRP